MITVLSYGWYKSKGVNMKVSTPFDFLNKGFYKPRKGVLRVQKRGFAQGKTG